MIWALFEVKGHVQGQLWVQLTTIYSNSKTVWKQISSFFKFAMVLGMGNVFTKFIAKKGMTSVDLLVKFKMAAKTAVKINKCNILALVWSISLCNTIFSMFYMVNFSWKICSRCHFNASYVILRYFWGREVENSTNPRWPPAAILRKIDF